jgi:hypothetical protein
MNLPIDVIPGTHPQRFKWQQRATTPIGDRVMDCEGPLPPSVEGAVVALINLAKRQAEHVVKLQEQCDEANRRANAAETLNSNQRQMLDQSKQPQPPKKKGNS